MIEFEHVSKIYPGNQVAVEDINMAFDSGEFVVFIGTSGSGKTTCMRMINSMIRPSSGRVTINGEDVAKMDPVALRRRIGYVIQQVGLMPHMTIYENIVMVPKLLKWDKSKLESLAKDLLAKVDLPASYLDRYPSELSGGQQQRIGVIRALAADQEIILMDEPFGALDPITRDALQQLVKRLQQEMGRTVVFVTHDMDEALALADKIAILDGGKLIQFDTPDNILLHPANEFVEQLLGEDRLGQARSSAQTVNQIMYRYPVTIKADRMSMEALTVMRDNRVDTLFVIDDDGLIQGLIDIFDIDRIRRHNIPVAEIMKECVYISEDTLIRDATYSIMRLGYRNLPVVDKKGRLTGLVTRAAIVESVYNSVWEGDAEEEPQSLEVIVQSTGEDHELPPELEQVLKEEQAEQVELAATDDFEQTDEAKRAEANDSRDKAGQA